MEAKDNAQRTHLDDEQEKMLVAVAKNLKSFECLPMVDPTTMKLSVGLNEFQRFLLPAEAHYMFNYIVQAASGASYFAARRCNEVMTIYLNQSINSINS